MTDPTSSATPRWGAPRMTVLLAGEGFDPKRLQIALAARWPEQQPELRSMFSGPGMERLAEAASAIAPCTIVLGGIAITCQPVPAPVDGLAEMIQFSRADRELLPALHQHRTHVMCATEAGAEQGIIATAHLVRLAVALEEQGAIGVVHDSACQCFTVARLNDHLKPEILAAIMDDGMFKMVWCNLIPFHTQGGSWMTSRGFSVAGVPDITMWARNADELKTAGEFLPGLFDYIKGGAVLAHGHTTQTPDGRVYRFGPVTDYAEFLNGAGETLALRPVDAPAGSGGSAATGTLLLSAVLLLLSGYRAASQLYFLIGLGGVQLTPALVTITTCFVLTPVACFFVLRRIWRSSGVPRLLPVALVILAAYPLVGRPGMLSISILVLSVLVAMGAWPASRR